MVEPIGDWPDFTRAILIVGKDDAGNPVGVFVDSAGFLAALMKGQKPDTTLANIAIDASGQLYAVLRGADDVDVAVDASGFLSAILKGERPDTSLGNVAVDSSGRIIMVPYGVTSVEGTATVAQVDSAREIRGSDGITLHTVRLDADGQLVMVPRGASGNYMAIDANGYMTAVLKGAYGGALTTIGVDSNGRIDAFLMDGSDQWNQQLRIGNADLAARLGSPCTHDWRGQVLWSNTFGNGIGTIKTMAIGTGAAVTVDPEYSLLDGYSLKMKGGSDSDRFALAYGYLGKPPGGRIGISVAVAGYAEETRIALRARSGATRYMGTLRYIWATNRLEYQNSGGGYSFEATKVLYGSTSIFNLLKVVIDTSTHYYARFLVNDTAYILSGDALYSDAGGFDGTMEFEIKVVSRAGLNDYQLIDRIIITNNEP